jgi:hypothetical protein
VLAAVYDTDTHNLLDLDDREHLAPSTMLLINSLLHMSAGLSDPTRHARRQIAEWIA